MVAWPISGRAAGFTYTEVLVAMVLIAAVLVPAVDALHGGIRGSAVHSEQAGQQMRLIGTMETVLAQSFEDLLDAADTAGDPTAIVAAYSDPPGTVNRCLVYLARYDGDDADSDGDPFTGTDDGLLWVRVAIEGSVKSLESLIGR